MTVYPIPQRELLTATPAAAIAHFGDAYALLANVNTYPAHGVLSTNCLPPNTVLHGSYELLVTAPVPPGSRLLLGLWALLAGGQRLPVFDAAGQPLPDSAYAMPWPTR